jgi:hypothetical protein
MALDLRENENCKKAVDEHVKVFGKLSVLVYNWTPLQPATGEIHLKL